jgi:hypothetical protein
MFAISTSLLLIWISFRRKINLSKVKRHGDYICSMANSGFGTTMLTGLSITWASYVSLYANDLREQLSTFNFHIESLVFTVTIFLAVMIAILKEMGSQRQSKESEKRIKEEYSALPPQTIINMISKDIILHNQNMTQLKEIVSALYLRTQVNKTQTSLIYKNLIKSIESEIDSIICNILKATKTWDNETNSNITYHVNFFHALNSKQLLTDYKNGKLSKSIIDSINSSSFFLFSDSFECKLSFCEYILLGSRQYSTCTEEKEKNAICLPFSSKKFEESNITVQPNLAGAPNSLYSSRNEHIGDIIKVFKEFCSELENSGHLDLTQRYLNGIKKYYAKDNARSLLSIPIKRYLNTHTYKAEIDEKFIGVLNIYADKKYMFKTNQKADAFYAIMSPLMHNLSILISMQVEVTNRSLSDLASDSDKMLEIKLDTKG